MSLAEEAKLAPATAVIRAAEALAQDPAEAAESVELFRHGTLQVKVYAPPGVDDQTPHRRDEAYVVLRGQGEFVSEGSRQAFAAGDFIFARAGVPHRFERFSSDFAVWVFFYGPDGGEK
ncbi:MAG TPA: cupin domain-containing protein [Terriglobales bacterium]|nr:cupin domain-containing protein [Terriglobales bacterium]